MVSGGCISHHNPLDAVGFASSKGKQDLSQSVTRPSATTTRRSDMLHDKEALLYRHKVKNHSTFRRTRIPDEDDDWGVQSPLRRIPIESATPPFKSATTTTTTLSKSNHNTRKSTPKGLQSRSPKASEAPLSPSKRPRNDENRKSPKNQFRGNQRSSGHIVRAGGNESPKTKERLPNVKNRRMLYPGDIESSMGRSATGSRPHASIRQIAAQMRLEDDEQPSENDTWDRNGNRGHSPLFESLRENTPMVERRGRTQHLFDLNHDFYDDHETKRLQAIVDTVKSMEASNYAETSTDDSRDYFPRQEKGQIREQADTQRRSRQRVTTSRQDLLEDGDEQHRLDDEIGLRMEAMVSDLSSYTGERTMDGNQQQLHKVKGPVERAALKMQKALSQAKTRIYPEYAPTFSSDGEENDMVSAATPEDDISDGFDRFSDRKQSNYELRKEQEFPVETPKSSNMLTGRPPVELYTSSPAKSGGYSHPKSPTATRPLKLNVKESMTPRKSTLNDAAGHTSRSMHPVQKAHTKNKPSTLASAVESAIKVIPLQRSQSSDSMGRGLFLRRSRSATPTKEASLHPDVQSSGSSLFQRSRLSSDSRPMTPNRFVKSRSNMNDSIRFMDLVAEQQLKEIRARRNQLVGDVSPREGHVQVTDAPQKERKSSAGRRKSEEAIGHNRRWLTNNNKSKQQTPHKQPVEMPRHESAVESMSLGRPVDDAERHPACGVGAREESTRNFRNSSRSRSPREPRHQRQRNLDEGRRASHPRTNDNEQRDDVATTQHQERHASWNMRSSRTTREDLRQALESNSQESYYDDCDDVSYFQRNRSLESDVREQSNFRRSLSRSPSPRKERQHRHNHVRDSSRIGVARDDMRSTSRGKDRDISGYSPRDEVRSSSRGKGLAGRLSSILGSFDTPGRQDHQPQEKQRHPPKLSDKLKHDMMDFDTLMKAIGDDRKNTLGAEFAVVELGDEESAIQTHAILMNRHDIEHQLLQARKPSYEL